LIVSTDPAHNLSDAFCQKIGREPTPINGFDNLSAMEIDANDDMEEMQRSMEEAATNEDDSGLQSLMAELTSSIPGIDEAMSFSELMKQVQNLDFDVVVFDTAPTGHTLRLLSFPTILEKALGKVMDLKDRFGGLIGQASAMFGGNSNPGQVQDMLLGRLEETRAVINKVNDAFQDPALTTFVRHFCPPCRLCVPVSFSLPFLSIYGVNFVNFYCVLHIIGLLRNPCRFVLCDNDRRTTMYSHHISCAKSHSLDCSHFSNKPLYGVSLHGTTTTTPCPVIF
jgi:anion-transporting  ArsA/GET3 family ATPase